MLNTSSAKIEKMIIHQVGNKGREEECIFSELSIQPSESLEALLIEHYLAPLAELEDTFDFNHEIDPSLNTVSVLSNAIFSTNETHDFERDSSEADTFEGDAAFQSASIKLAKHLYGVTSHPNIAGGDFIIILFSNLFEGMAETQALGIFKVESKDDYLDIYDNNGTLEFVEKEGISLKDIQKGALVLAHDMSVLAIDSKKRTKYWHDDFLNLKSKQTELAELKAGNDVLKGLSKRIEAPDQHLAFNKGLEAHLDEHDEIRLSDLENLSKNYMEDQDVNRVFHAAQNKAGFEIDRNIAIPSHEFREQSQKIMKKMRVAEGIDLVISNKDAYLNSIQIEETPHGFRAVIDFDTYEPEE